MGGSSDAHKQARAQKGTEEGEARQQYRQTDLGPTVRVVAADLARVHDIQAVEAVEPVRNGLKQTINQVQS